MLVSCNTFVIQGKRAPLTRHAISEIWKKLSNLKSSILFQQAVICITFPTVNYMLYRTEQIWKNPKMRFLFSPLPSHLLLLPHTNTYSLPQETFHPCYISTGLHTDTPDLNLVNQIHYPPVCLNRTSKLLVVFCIKH